MGGVGGAMPDSVGALAVSLKGLSSARAAPEPGCLPAHSLASLGFGSDFTRAHTFLSPADRPVLTPPHLVQKRTLMPPSWVACHSLCELCTP